MAAGDPRPEELAPGVYCLQTGRGLTEANVYLVRSGPTWGDAPCTARRSSSSDSCSR
jgi:hypothetical protein